jgi:endonuclease/exonuclease/phosphatase family metal-dependent hydrolase
VNPIHALRCLFTHTTPAARLASDHFPVVADIDLSVNSPEVKVGAPTEA